MTQATANSGVAAFPQLSQAQALLEKGRPEQASALIIEHLRRHPEEPRGLALLGTAAMQVGALGQGEIFLRRALGKGGDERQILRTLATILMQREKIEEALSLIEKLRAEDPAETQLIAMQASLFEKIGRHEEAMELHLQIAERMTENAGPLTGYAHASRSAGKVDQAADYYRRALASDDGHGEAWWGLASVRRSMLSDEEIARLEASLTKAVDPRNMALMQFALGKTRHDRGEHEAAFSAYATGNRLRAEIIGYDPRELTEEVGEIERSVSAPFMQRMTKAATSDVMPIFVISLPRSGSTLLEQMLGSHPEIEPAGELPYIPAILRSVMEAATRRGPVTVPQMVARIPDDQAAAMGQDYLRRAALHHGPDCRYFVDKLPHNWSNVLFIRRILPQARFIDIRRAAMDCCFSNFVQSFTNAHGSSFSLEAMGQCYRDYVRLMDHFEKVAPGLVHHMRYEELIEGAEAELKAALDYIGVQWDPAVLSFHESTRVVRTPSSEQVRRPLNRDGVKAWAPYSQWLDPLRRSLGKLAD